jgi:hypothetical protein
MRLRLRFQAGVEFLAAEALAQETPVRRSPQGGGGSTPRRSQHEDAQAAVCRNRRVFSRAPDDLSHKDLWNNSFHPKLK